MIPVRSVMRPAPPMLGVDRTVADAAELMEQEQVGVVPLGDDRGALVGVVTDRDLVLRVLARRLDPAEVTLGDVATVDLAIVSPDVDVSEALDLMAERGVRRIPVVEAGRLVGILALGDIALVDVSRDVEGMTSRDAAPRGSS